MSDRDTITLPREVVERLVASWGRDTEGFYGSMDILRTALRKALAAEQPKPEAQDWLITGNTFTSTPPEPYANWPAFFAEMIRTRTIRGLQIGAALAAEQPSEEAEALRRDAERYRLLRRGQRWSVINGIGDALRAEELDAAIDAAMGDKT